MPRQSEVSNQGENPKRLGRYMILGAWLLLLGLLTLMFNAWMQREANPNRVLSIAENAAGEQTVRLQRNRAGHYLAPGQINGMQVTFIVDTGATRVAVPLDVAERTGLVKGVRAQSITASGVADTWLTQVDRLRLGPFEMESVPAVIIPAMPGDQVLLGMSFLKYLELTQQGDGLSISLPK
jgi:aspartyl protease family protein